MCLMCDFTVLVEMYSSLAISAVVSMPETRRSTCSSRLVRGSAAGTGGSSWVPGAGSLGRDAGHAAVPWWPRALPSLAGPVRPARPSGRASAGGPGAEFVGVADGPDVGDAVVGDVEGEDGD